MKNFNEWLENRTLQEVTSPVSGERIDYFAQKIINVLQDTSGFGFSGDRIKSLIYKFLTYTNPAPPEEQIPQGFEMKYMELLPKIPMPNYIRVKEATGFVNFTTNTERPNRVKIGTQQEAKVTMKNYFSLHTPLDKLRDVLNHLWQTLPMLAYELYKVALKNKDQINFKLPDQLWMLLEHPDSIVVHYYNPASGPEVQAVVNSLFPNQIDRGVRVQSGFDINHPDIQNPEKETGNSHSELIAWAIAGTIVKEKDRILSKYDSHTFGQKLLDVVKTYSNMDMHNLYQQYLFARQNYGTK